MPDTARMTVRAHGRARRGIPHISRRASTGGAGEDDHRGAGAMAAAASAPRVISGEMGGDWAERRAAREKSKRLERFI